MQALPLLCDICGRHCRAHGCGTGYGVAPDGRRVCYVCCADSDRAYMLEHGRITLYLDTTGARVTNWPGTLAFRTGPIRRGRHNIARWQYCAWFTGPDGATWIARQYGDDTQIAHCRRLKHQ